ncbi:primosomal replication protein N [Thalassotalea sp. M1531]|uniref:Replication restart protein PriB n=1 Tax=Thalassotalea algicola TaxID=2716224 RepID=A0A7Y0LC99_9GAMM|nr:primosomal replication protein N [Thalassotalea algicola]NMP31914.1 primosomal replication protein N [Thalassotalea algicola]
MTNNCLVLVGNVVKPPQLSTSPAGVHHCQFSIEHRSIQVEDGMNRQAFVRMQVVATGDWSQRLACELTEGMQVQVSGFINRHESRSGNPILALHAQQIEMIN